MTDPSEKLPWETPGDAMRRELSVKQDTRDKIAGFHQRRDDARIAVLGLTLRAEALRMRADALEAEAVALSTQALDLEKGLRDFPAVPDAEIAVLDGRIAALRAQLYELTLDIPLPSVPETTNTALLSERDTMDPFPSTEEQDATKED